jgi:hypothetical protein
MRLSLNCVTPKKVNHHTFGRMLVGKEWSPKLHPVEGVEEGPAPMKIIAY